MPPPILSLSFQIFRAVLTVWSATQKQVPEYLVNEAVASGKKAEMSQPRFHATCKTAGRKRKGNVLK